MKRVVLLFAVAVMMSVTLLATAVLALAVPNGNGYDPGGNPTDNNGNKVQKGITNNKHFFGCGAFCEPS